MWKKIGLTIMLLVAMTAVSFAADDLASAFKEGKISGNIRSYYFTRDFDKKTADTEDFAIGGVLNAQTAPLKGFSVSVGFKTSQGASWNDDDMGVHGLFAKDSKGDHENYTALNQYYLQFEGFDTKVKFGAQNITTPWLNAHDIRLTPNTYRALSIVNKSIPKVELYAYYVDEIMTRTSTEFQSMSESISSKITDEKPVIIGGIVWKAPGALKIQFWDYYTQDVHNMAYMRADYSYKLNKDYTLLAGLRLFNQDDVGDALAGEIDTYMAGGSLGVKAYGARLDLLYAKVGDDSLVIQWGHNKVIAQQVYGSDKADQDSYGAKLFYDFGQIGLKGLSSYVYYATYDTPDSGKNASQDFDEIDLDLQYKFDKSLKGLSLRLRHAIVQKAQGGEDLTDSRVYLQYVF
ncbi:OprD family outer membrane porin [Desulfobacula sp.]|uniref:OprD family outer membrane porin n=1 Tax=Desulfobacula sp. TaxID=2593537 RepID=UPI0027153401|nr:OprD family outer membrane porin [Desulfobacula sp.]